MISPVCCAINSTMMFCFRKKVGIKMLMLLSAIMLGNLLFAEETSTEIADTSKVHRLREINVTALNQNSLLKSPVPVQALTITDLQKMNTLSVAEAVRFLSGVQLKDYGGVGGLKTINVRSLGANHTDVMYDGVLVGNAQNGQVDLGRISLDNIEEIVLYSGQKAQMLQPALAYASASSLYLKSKVPVFQNQKKYNASIALKTGSFGLFNPTLALDYQWNPNLSSRFSAEHLSATGKYKFRYTNGAFDTTATRQNSDVDALKLEYSLFGKIKNGVWNAKLYHYQSERGLPRAIVSNRFEASQRLWDKSTFLQASLDKKLSKYYQLAINAKYAYDYTRYLDPEYVAEYGFLDNKYHQKEIYFSVANSYQLLPFWDVALAADYKNNVSEANLDRYAYPNRNSFFIALASNFRFPRWQARFSLLNTSIHEKVKYYNTAGNKQKYTPTAMFSWQPLASTDHFHIRGFYKSIFRMPTFNDLYYTIVGNTYLKPEQAQQYDLGFTFSKYLDRSFINRLEVQVDAYYNKVNNKIVAIPSANLFRWTMVNLNLVEIKGVDANVKLQKNIDSNTSADIGFTYTYQQALDITDKTLNQLVPYTPEHSGSFIASLNRKQASLNYNFIYTGERYGQAAKIPANYIEPWYTHDVSIQYIFQQKKTDLTFRAEVNNLFNQYFDVIRNFPMPGRSYRFSLYYKI